MKSNHVGELLIMALVAGTTGTACTMPGPQMLGIFPARDGLESAVLIVSDAAYSPEYERAQDEKADGERRPPADGIPSAGPDEASEETVARLDHADDEPQAPKKAGMIFLASAKDHHPEDPTISDLPKEVETSIVRGRNPSQPAQRPRISFGLTLSRSLPGPLSLDNLNAPFGSIFEPVRNPTAAACADLRRAGIGHPLCASARVRRGR